MLFNESINCPLVLPLLLKGLGYASFVVWLVETVIVYCYTINQQDEVTSTSSLIWSQEIPEVTPPPDIEDTAA